MNRKYLLFLISFFILGMFLLTMTSDIGTRISKKIQITISSFQAHPDYVLAPAVVLGQATSVISLENIPHEKIEPENTISVPTSYFLNNLRHEYQSWNNCGPATLSMALSFYNLPHKQKEIAPYLKPDPEDKNVSPQEIVEYVKTHTNYKVIYTFNANLHQIKLLTSNEIPVIVETWYEPKPNDGMGHYQLVQGYDETKKEFYLYDSYKGPNVVILQQKLDTDWKVFNRTILVVFPEEKQTVVNQILGDLSDTEHIYIESVNNAQREIEKDQSDAFAWFNLGTSYSLMGKHSEATIAFDKARSLKLPWRMLWYQFAIFDAYLATGRVADVLALTTLNLKQANNLEESLFYRAKANLQLNRKDTAKIDLQKAVKYNKNYQPAQEELKKL